MLIDIFPIEFMPDIMVWMDWKLYQHPWLFFFNAIVNVYVTANYNSKEKNKNIKMSVPKGLLISTMSIFIFLYITDGGAVG